VEAKWPENSPEGTMVADIVSRVQEILARRGSTLVLNGALNPDFERNVVEIMNEVIASFEQGEPTQMVAVEYRDGLRRTAEVRATERRHPAESLMAAEVLFGVALPRIIEHLEVQNLSPTDVATVAATLHQIIWRRFPPGAIAYVEFILNRLSAANLESDLRVSRQLHDGIAHVLAIALQRIELASIAPTPDAFESELTSARAQIVEAMEAINGIATDLRQKVGSLQLSEALDAYIQRVPSSSATIDLEILGDERSLAPAVSEEAFTITLEALRNALRHAQARQIVVRMNWLPTSLKITIEDDGKGFDSMSERNSIGLKSMAERAIVLNGQLAITPRPGRGTVVTLAVPISAKSE
jgi:signal transduction histidine kinase